MPQATHVLTQPDSLRSAAAATAVLGVVVYLAVMAVLHIRDKSHSPVRDAVSDYGVGPTRRLSVIAFAGNTTAAVMLAVALSRVPGIGFASTPVVLLLFVVLTRIGVIIVPTDPTGTRRTARGTVHLLLAVAQFTLAYELVSGQGPRLAGLIGWDGAATVQFWLGRVVLIGLIALCAALVLPKLRPFFGLCERVFLLGVAAWTGFIALGLLLTA